MTAVPTAATPSDPAEPGTGPVEGGAFGTGLATVTAGGTVLDVWYPAPALLVASAGTPVTAQPELRLAERTDDIRGVTLRVVQTRIASLADAPADTADAYLRLHLLSARVVRPRTINLDGIFAVLPNNVWTSIGPVPPEEIEQVRLRALEAGSGCRSSGWTSSRG